GRRPRGRPASRLPDGVDDGRRARDGERDGRTAAVDHASALSALVPARGHSVSSELKKIARGFRWFRPAALPRAAPVPPLRTEANYDTDWARNPWANTTRDVIHEMLL